MHTAWASSYYFTRWLSPCRFAARCRTLMVRKHCPAEIRPEGPFGQFRRFQRKIWAFLKNLAFEESSSQSTTLYAKHSSIYLLSSFEKCTHFVLRPKLRATDWALFREKVFKKFMSIKNCVYVHFEDKNMNFE